MKNQKPTDRLLDVQLPDSAFTRLQVLGPMVVSRNELIIHVGGSRIRRLLASLLLSPGKVVTVDHLIDRLWNGPAPKDPRRVVQTNVVRLRHALPADVPIVTRPGGYMIDIDADRLDLLQFQTLVTVAEGASEIDRECELLHAALGLWRGDVCQDVDSEVLHENDVAQLAERRLVALERRIDLDLLLGRTERLGGELRMLTAQFPLRERFWAQLMASLYLQGRRGEALETYRAIAKMLSEELGIDPGSELRELHRQMLNDEYVAPNAGKRNTDIAINPHLASSEAVVAAVHLTDDPAPGASPRELPTDVAHFVGRGAELAALDRILSTGATDGVGGSVVVVDGSAGVGKTALAVRWCNRVADIFHGGQIYLNLRGFGALAAMEPLGALHVLLRSVGVPAESVPHDVAACSALFRSRTAGRHMLILLDNARNSDQVRPLLAGGSCVTVVTSRNQLRGLVAREAAKRVSVQPLPIEDSVEVLTSAIGSARIQEEYNEALLIAKICDYNPLALRLIGERIGRMQDARLRDVVDELDFEFNRLDAFNANDGDLADLRAVFSWSYDHLESTTAAVLRLVGGLYPGNDIGLATAAAISGLGLADTRWHLDRLVATNLVEQSAYNRYRLHDLLRTYAAERTHQQDSAEARAKAQERLLQWFRNTLINIDEIFAPDRYRDPAGPFERSVPVLSFRDHRSALAWCEVEYPTLIALPGWASDIGEFEMSGQIAYLLESLLANYKHWHDFLYCHKPALAAAAKIGDRRLEGHLLNAVGNALAETRQPAHARERYEAAIQAFRADGYIMGEAKVLGNLAMLAVEQEDLATAERLCVEALDICTAIDYSRGRAHSLDNLGELSFARSDFVNAIRNWRRALEINKKARARYVQATNLTNLGRAYNALGNFDRAITYQRAAESISREIGSDRGVAIALLHLGRTFRSAGEAEVAAECWTEALNLFVEAGDADADEVKAALASLGS
ncbi:tetratricopeptide repeat protein [Micromonospora sp. NBC_00362]|uniref:AfsR/SARP family transcriptional regulator n=1 Tax=Micromonospora sp. NBC_00362 TaxID=2975975 RepID=UPI00225A3C56|nr:BTAD domain-containing putative transcriptional regulator [Micromonospora sp. NBC_00362]MCX5121765.1 tetratricopeptide repeat protein [Micromonospora sp. NBC_00362]